MLGNSNDEHCCVLQESTAAQIITYFEGGQADLVVCDGAPDG